MAVWSYLWNELSFLGTVKAKTELRDKQQDLSPLVIKDVVRAY